MMQDFIGIIGALAVIAGAIIEWRRSDQAHQIAQLEERVAALAGVAERVSTLEASIERLRRNL